MMLRTVQRIQFVSSKIECMVSGWLMRKLLDQRLHGCKFYGMPRLELFSARSLVIGDGVTVNSMDRSYHLSMHSPCKFIANTADARIVIGSHTRIHGSCLHAKRSVSIGHSVLIAANCHIMDTSGHLLSPPDPCERLNTVSVPKPVVIEDGVWIGANSLVLPGVTIGRGSVVAAGSVVTRSVPSGVLVGGNPAQLVRSLS